MHCPARRTLALIADKSTSLVLYALADGAHRFNELQRRCDGISRKMLTQTLRRPQRDGLVHRTVYPVVPPHTEYNLTDLGESLMAPLASLCAWGARICCRSRKRSTRLLPMPASEYSKPCLERAAPLSRGW